MQDCMIGDEGVSWLATALGRGNLPKLESLYLMGCPNVRCRACPAAPTGPAGRLPRRAAHPRSILRAFDGNTRIPG